MRGPTLLLLLLASVAPCIVPTHSVQAAEPWNWDQWRRLPVQDRGRRKPLDTMTRDTLRAITHRRNCVDPETGERLTPVAMYLRMLFDRQTWDEPAGLSAGIESAGTAGYFTIHQPDKWDRMLLFHVDDIALREALGMPAGNGDISAVALYRANFADPEAGREIPFPQWIEQFESGRRRPVSRFEEHALRLATRMRLYQTHRMGLGMNILPVVESPSQEWWSVRQLLNSDLDTLDDSSGVLWRTRANLRKVIAAVAEDSPDRFNECSATFLSSTIDGGLSLGMYADLGRIDLEVAYNHWKPLRGAWILTLSALLALCLSGLAYHRILHAFAISAFAAGQIAILLELSLRIVISERAPVTNMYESVVFAGLGIGVLGLMIALGRRKRLVLFAAAGVTTLLLILADCCPVALDPAIDPLQPVLRSDFWLIVHVMTITLSYSAFVLALGVGNITLVYFIAHSRNWAAIDALGSVNLRCLRIGTLLLAVGTATGAVWADYSWGRFWGWDPKEVWALITLLGYLAILHARSTHWVSDFALASLSVICFSLVVIAWYGVNFVLGSGLHSYGSGHGGKELVFASFFVQFLFVAIAAARSVGHVRPT